MDHPSQWHYMATGLMAHMGTYSLDEMNELQWLWHRRATLRIRKAMQRQNIWAIPGSAGTRDTPLDTGNHGPKRSRSPPGKRRAMTPQDATRGHRLVWVPPLAHTEAPSDHSPRGGTEAALIPQGCRVAGQNGTRKQGTLRNRGAAAARHLPQHGESSSTRVQAEAMEAPTTRWQTSSVADLPIRRSADPPVRYRGTECPDTRQRGPAPDQRPEQGVGGQIPQSPPPQAGRDSRPTNPAHEPQGSPCWLRSSQTTGARRTHHNNGGTTQATQEQTRK